MANLTDIYPDPGVKVTPPNIPNTGTTGVTTGKIDAQGIASALGGAASAFGTAYSTISDVQSPEQLIPMINSFRLNPNAGGNSLDSWTQSYLSTPKLNELSLKNVGWNTTKGIFNTFGSTLQGAFAGSKLGLAGTIFGGFGGLGAGLYGLVRGKQKANETRYLGNEAIKAVDKYNQDLLTNRLATIEKNQFTNLARRAAFGGPLNMSGEGIMSPFGSRFAAGGLLHAYGSDWSNGLTFVNAGGSHEENPNEGVQMGVDPQGVPNLVEEGEVIYNDYVFSKRMKVPKKDKIKYKLGGLKLTYAEAAKKAQKESEERPNDPISKRGLEWIMAKLAESQETQREEQYMREVAKYAKQLGVSPEELLAMIEQQQAQEQQPQMQSMMQQPMMAAYGGELFTDGLDGVMYANGGKIHINPKNRGKFNATKKRTGKTTEELTHSKNPLTRKRAIFAQNAKKWKHGLGGNLFWPGGSMDNYSMYGPWDNYIQDPTDPRFYSLGIWGPELTPSYGTSEGITTQGTPANNSILGKRIVFPNENLVQHFAIPESTQKQVQANVKSKITKNNLGPGVVNGPDYDWMTGLRFAPILSSAGALVNNLLNKPDYSRWNTLLDNDINDIAITPKYNYMQYRPIDRMMMANKIGQQAAATGRNIMNTSGGNRGTAIAGLLASDNQYLNKLGEAFIAGDAENYKRYAQTLDVNNNINKWLADVDFNVQRANQGAGEARTRYKKDWVLGVEGLDAARGAAISNEWSNLAQGLGDIGWEQFNRNMVNTSNPLYGIDSSGQAFFKGGKQAESLMKMHLSEEDYAKWRKAKPGDADYNELLVKAYANLQRGKSYSRGGYLTIKGRRK